jgi:20S proteasome subunit alpha 4
LSDDESIRLTVKALLEVVDSGSKNMEIAVIKNNEAVNMIKEEQLKAIISDIEREQEEAKKATQQDSTTKDT